MSVALPNNIPEPIKNTTIIKAITNKIVFMMLLINANHLTSYSEYTPPLILDSFTSDISPITPNFIECALLAV